MQKNKTRDFGNIYRFIYKEKQSSRQQIAEQLGISLPTVTQNLNLLKDNNLIYISGTYESSGGRKANIFKCVPNSHYALGIDITRNHIVMVLINLDLEITESKRIRITFEDTEEYYNTMCSEVEAFLDLNPDARQKLLGIGISLPAIIEVDHRSVYYASVIKISKNIYERLQEKLPYPFLLFNDASSAGLAESWFSNTDEPVIYLLLSGSVGGSFTNAGNPFFGNNSKAAEFGHMCIVPNGRQCYCGCHGCLDAYCSSKILTAFTNGSLEDFFKELSAGNEGFRRVFDEYLDYLAIAVNNLRMCYDCDIIIGGTVGAYMAPYLDTLRQKAIALNPFEEDSSYIRSCHYKTSASAVGAAIYYINEFIEAL